MNTIFDYNPQKSGERLRALRENKGYTRAEAAELLHIVPDHLRHIECGDKKYSAELLERMSDLYQVSMDFISKGVPGTRTTDTEFRIALSMAIEELEESQRKMNEAIERFESLLNF